MLKTPAYAAASATTPLGPFSIERREAGPRDVRIDILYCGVCHSDIHQVRDEWGGSIFPMVPGHEIVGTVVKVGQAVEKWKLGDTVGVGCFVDSCRECEACRTGEEQYCTPGMTLTYNGYERDGKTPTYGGYSTRITWTRPMYCAFLGEFRSSARHRCYARASPPIRRCAISASRPEIRSPWWDSAASATWP